MGERKSFILHKDSLKILDDLTNEQVGLLFKAIKNYQFDEISELDTLTKIAFSPFKNQFIRDDEKYDNLCKKNKLIAERRYSTKSTSSEIGGKITPKNTKSTSGEIGGKITPKNTKSTDNDSKNDSKSKSDSDKELKIKDTVFNFKTSFLKLGVDKIILDDWLSVRKKKKASNTETAFNSIIKEIGKSGLEANEAIKISAERSWSGFKSQWIENEKGNNNYGHQPIEQASDTISDQEAIDIAQRAIDNVSSF